MTDNPSMPNLPLAKRLPWDRTYDLLRRFGYERVSELATVSGMRPSTVRRHLDELKAEGRAWPLDEDGLWGAV